VLWSGGEFQGFIIHELVPTHMAQRTPVLGSYDLGQDNPEVARSTGLVNGYKRGPEYRKNSTCTRKVRSYLLRVIHLDRMHEGMLAGIKPLANSLCIMWEVRADVVFGYGIGSQVTHVPR
jgi:hypothetical protein